MSSYPIIQIAVENLATGDSIFASQPNFKDVKMYQDEQSICQVHRIAYKIFSIHIVPPELAK